MSRPWMPLYVADYLGDTGHLSTVEHGCYMLLIMHYWQHGGLPDCDTKLARICRMQPAEWSEVRETIADLFDDGWSHARIEEEMVKAEEIITKRSAAGKAGAEARYGKRIANARQTHKQTDSHPQPPSPSSSLRSEEKTPNGVSTASGFDEFWKAYPRREGDNPKKPAKQAYSRALKRGGTPEAILAGAQALARKHPTPTPYVPQAVTWLNQDRWADDSIGPPGGEVVVEFRRADDVIAERVAENERKARALSGS